MTPEQKESRIDILKQGIELYETYKSNHMTQVVSLDLELEEQSRIFNEYKKENKEKKKVLTSQVKDIQEFILNQERELVKLNST